MRIGHRVPGNQWGAAAIVDQRSRQEDLVFYESPAWRRKTPTKTLKRKRTRSQAVANAEASNLEDATDHSNSKRKPTAAENSAGIAQMKAKCVVSVSNQWCRTLLEHSAPTPSLPRQQQVRCRTALYPTNLPTRLQTSKGSRQQNSRRSSLTSLLHLPVTKRPASGRSRSL